MGQVDAREAQDGAPGRGSGNIPAAVGLPKDAAAVRTAEPVRDADVVVMPPPCRGFPWKSRSTEMPPGQDAVSSTGSSISVAGPGERSGLGAFFGGRKQGVPSGICAGECSDGGSVAAEEGGGLSEAACAAAPLVGAMGEEGGREWLVPPAASAGAVWPPFPVAVGGLVSGVAAVFLAAFFMFGNAPSKPAIPAADANRGAPGPAAANQGEGLMAPSASLANVKPRETVAPVTREGSAPEKPKDLVEEVIKLGGGDQHEELKAGGGEPVLHAASPVVADASPGQIPVARAPASQPALVQHLAAAGQGPGRAPGEAHPADAQPGRSQGAAGGGTPPVTDSVNGGSPGTGGGRPVEAASAAVSPGEGVAKGQPLTGAGSSAPAVKALDPNDPLAAAKEAVEEAKTAAVEQSSGVASIKTVATEDQLSQTSGMVTVLSSLVTRSEKAVASLRVEVAQLRQSVDAQLADLDRRMNMREARQQVEIAKAFGASMDGAGKSGSNAGQNAASVSPAMSTSMAVSAKGKKGAALAHGLSAPAATQGEAPGTRRRYRIQAASPGLAMLTEIGGGDGAQVQVAVGDRIDGYGRVTKIVERGTSWVVEAEQGSIQ